MELPSCEGKKKSCGERKSLCVYVYVVSFLKKKGLDMNEDLVK